MALKEVLRKKIREVEAAKPRRKQAKSAVLSAPELGITAVVKWAGVDTPTIVEAVQEISKGTGLPVRRTMMCKKCGGRSFRRPYLDAEGREVPSSEVEMFVKVGDRIAKVERGTTKHIRIGTFLPTADLPKFVIVKSYEVWSEEKGLAELVRYMVENGVMGVAEVQLMTRRYYALIYPIATKKGTAVAMDLATGVKLFEHTVEEVEEVPTLLPPVDLSVFA